LLRVGKLVITVRAAYSSMTCSECGHVDAASRKSQSEFVCTKCHHAENADTNAAKVLHRRTFDAVRDGTWAEKPKKKTAFLKRKALPHQVRRESTEPVRRLVATGLRPRRGNQTARALCPRRIPRRSGKPDLHSLPERRSQER